MLTLPSLHANQDFQLRKSIHRKSLCCGLRLRLADNPLARQMLDELIIAGEMQESSKKSVLRAVSLGLQ